MRKLKQQASRNIYRVIDANLNRTKEGLRVCEEVFRFIVSDRARTAEFKKIRHSIDSIFKSVDYRTVLRHRDIEGDVGRGYLKTELRRLGPDNILRINMQRVKESLRVLEEFLKLIDKKAALGAKDARYRVYRLEKKISERL